MEIYLGLGSNLGDRETYIRESVKRLENNLETPCCRLSDLIRNEAQGFIGGWFLNGVAVFDVPDVDGDGSIRADYGLHLLDICKDIERALGRTAPAEYAPDGSRIYHDRTIDIDILFIGDWLIDTGRLTVPHPCIGERPFVTGPLKQVASSSLKASFPSLFESK